MLGTLIGELIVIAIIYYFIMMIVYPFTRGHILRNIGKSNSLSFSKPYTVGMLFRGLSDADRFNHLTGVLNGHTLEIYDLQATVLTKSLRWKTIIIIDGKQQDIKANSFGFVSAGKIKNFLEKIK